MNEKLTDRGAFARYVADLRALVRARAQREDRPPRIVTSAAVLDAAEREGKLS